MKKLLLLTAFSAFFFACKKDDNPLATNVGSILYQNQSGDTYNIFLEGGNYGQVPPNSSKVIPNISADSHTVKAVQANNFTIKPKSKENRILVRKNDTTFFSFPD